MTDHVQGKCQDNAVERDAKDSSYIRQGLINLYKLDKSHYAQHIAEKKRCSISYTSALVYEMLHLFFSAMC